VKNALPRLSTAKELYTSHKKEGKKKKSIYMGRRATKRGGGQKFNSGQSQCRKTLGAETKLEKFVHAHLWDIGDEATDCEELWQTKQKKRSNP